MVGASPHGGGREALDRHVAERRLRVGGPFTQRRSSPQQRSPKTSKIHVHRRQSTAGSSALSCAQSNPSPLPADRSLYADLESQRTIRVSRSRRSSRNKLAPPSTLSASGSSGMIHLGKSRTFVWRFPVLYCARRHHTREGQSLQSRPRGDICSTRLEHSATCCSSLHFLQAYSVLSRGRA